MRGACMRVCAVLGLVAQSCLTHCDPMDCSLPGPSLHGILQERILEWVDIFYSRRSYQHRGQTHISMSPALAGGFFFYHLHHLESPTESGATSYFPELLKNSNNNNKNFRNFSASPVFKTLQFQCRGCGFHPWSGN